IVANIRRTYRCLPAGVAMVERRLMVGRVKAAPTVPLRDRADQQHWNLDEVTDAVDGRPADEIVEEAMAVRGHRQQIDAALFSEANQLVGGIAHRELGGDLQPVRGEIGRELRQVIAVVLHLFGFAQLQLIEIARRPSIRHVHQMQFGADLRRELAHVFENRLVGGGMLDSHENAAVHLASLQDVYASVWTSSHALSAAMITATVQASTRIHAGATKGPIFARSEVKRTSGNTAKDSCRLNTTWLAISSAPVPRSPYNATTMMAGMMASSRVTRRRSQGRTRRLMKPSITIWPASVPVSVAFWPEQSSATANRMLAAPVPSSGESSW